jgi:hypothetical protein
VAELTGTEPSAPCARPAVRINAAGARMVILITPERVTGGQQPH